MELSFVRPHATLQYLQMSQSRHRLNTLPLVFTVIYFEIYRSFLTTKAKKNGPESLFFSRLEATGIWLRGEDLNL